MAITVQNLRAVEPGVEPLSLLPGQLCFNVIDKVMFVGDGTSLKTSFRGTSVPGVAGQGWYSMPLDFAALRQFFVDNPSLYGDTPSDQQVLTWDETLGHPVWSGVPDSGGQVYTTSNAQVVSAPGATASEKISSAIGVSSPEESDVAIVTGVPDDAYQGLYFFTTEWIRGSSYAYPSASEVIYDNGGGSLGSTVQTAIDDLNTDVIATTAVADFASSTATSALGIANAALPRTGGTMTGLIAFDANQTFPASGISDATTTQKGVVQVGANIDVAAGTISVKESNTTQQGVVQLNDSTSSASTTTALTANQGRLLQNQINALTISGGVTLAGGFDPNIPAMDSVTTAGAAAGFVVGFDLPLPATTNNNYYVIVIADNPAYSPPGGGGPYALLNGDWLLSDGVTWTYLGVGQRPATATYTTAGIVQLADPAATLLGISDTEAITPQSLQDKVSDSVSTTCSLTIASSTAVKDAYDLASAAIPCSVIIDKGAIITGVATSLPTALPVGLDGQVLVANSTCATGLEWVSDTPGDVTSVGGSLPITVDNTDPQNPIVGVTSASTTASGVVQLLDSVNSTSTTLAATPNSVKSAYDLGFAAIPCSAITSKGAIPTKDAGNTALSLPVGADGQVLIANSACTTGLEWVNDTPGDVSSVTSTFPITVDNTDPQNPVVGVDAASTTSPGVVQLDDTVSSTSVTEAGTANAVKTAYDIGAAAIPCSTIVNKGSIVTGTSAGVPTALPLGSDGQVLIVNSTCVSGLEWVSDAPGDVTLVSGAAPVTVNNADPQNPIVGVNPAAAGTYGVVFGLTGDNVSGYNVALGFGANGTLTTGTGNVAIGGASGDMTSGSYNVAIGFDVNVNDPAGDRQLAIGPDAYTRWLTGDSSMNIKPGAGLRDGADSLGTAGQVLSSTGTTLQWINNTPDGVLGVTGTSPITVDNTDPQNPIVSVNAATTTSPGISQLNDTVTSTSATEAATANAVKTAYDSAINSVQSLAGTAPVQVDNTDPQNPVISADAATLLSPGVVQLNDTTSSTSTTEAATANAVKTAYDLASGKVSEVTGTSPVSVDNTSPTNPIISIDAATTATPGVVQLDDTVTCNSFTVAATARAVCEANTLASNAIPCSAYVDYGSVLVGTATGEYTAIPTGSNGQVLSIDATCTLSGGITWAAPQAGLCGYTCASNTALGVSAASNVSSGSGNTVVGNQAGCLLTSGLQNTLIGSGAGKSVSGASCIVAVGYNAAAASSSSQGNTAIGSNALECATSSGNTAVGAAAGRAINSGANNTLVGLNTGAKLTTGGQNVGLGRDSLGCAVGGSFNVALGSCSGCSITTGCCNVLVGDFAGRSIVNGGNNTIIGGYAGIAALFDNVVIGAGSNIKLQINESNALSIGPTASYGTLGQVLTSGGSGAVPTWCTPSGLTASCFPSKGSLLAGTGTGTFSALAVPAQNGCFLATCSTCTTGLVWTCAVSSASFLTTGTLIVGNNALGGSFTQLNTGATSGCVLTSNSACSVGMQWASPAQVNFALVTPNNCSQGTTYPAFCIRGITTASMLGACITYLACRPGSGAQISSRAMFWNGSAGGLVNFCTPYAGVYCTITEDLGFFNYQWCNANTDLQINWVNNVSNVCTCLRGYYSLL